MRGRPLVALAGSTAAIEKPHLRQHHLSQEQQAGARSPRHVPSVQGTDLDRPVPAGDAKLGLLRDPGGGNGVKPGQGVAG
jgi:hypothetical protein